MSAIRVIQFTDPHLFGDLAGTLRGVNTYETLERTLADASGQIAMCDAILVTGDLVQDDAGLYLAGIKSYGRAPTFLMITGYEQVRSIAADIAGDREAAERVELELPETGVCTRSGGEGEPAVSGCCGGPAPAMVDACCADDADAKAVGKTGCGCS